MIVCYTRCVISTLAVIWGSRWVGMAMLLWPLLDRKIPEPLVLPSTGTEKLPNFGINRASVLRALVLFNVVIGFQTGVDFSILVGGAELPAGMSYASYAHRGAYPLLATALLGISMPSLFMVSLKV